MTIPDNKELYRLLDKTKGKLFMKQGAAFLGSLLCSVEQIFVPEDDEIQTACTNGKYIKWNSKFFYNLPPETRVSVMAHELWHIGYMHMIRINDRNPIIWNMAADHVINLMLVEHNFTWDGYFNNGMKIKDNIFCDSQFKNMTTEEVYEKLLEGGESTSYQMQDIIPVDNGDNEKGNKSSVISAVVSAIQQANMSKKAGSIPGEIEMYVDKFLNPKLPWQVILQNFFTELTNDDYSYRKPNKRFTDPILPSISDGEGLSNLLYFIDTSGSITDQEILRVNSEIKYIKEQLEPEKLTVIQFDTRIRNIRVFEKDDPFSEIYMVGRGGTDLTEVYEYIKNNPADAAIIFSDLYVTPMDDPGIPVVWIVVNSSIVPPFGTHVTLNE